MKGIILKWHSNASHVGMITKLILILKVSHLNVVVIEHNLITYRGSAQYVAEFYKAGDKAMNCQQKSELYISEVTKRIVTAKTDCASQLCHIHTDYSALQKDCRSKKCHKIHYRYSLAVMQCLCTSPSLCPGSNDIHAL